MSRFSAVLCCVVLVFFSVAYADHGHNVHAAEPVVKPEAPVVAKAGETAALKVPLPWDHKCYVCNTRNDAGCERPGEHHVKECNSSAVGCWKLYQQIEYDQEFDLKAHYRIVRQCAYHLPEGHAAKVPCVYRSGFGGMSTYCFCNHTTCNWGISSLSASSPLLVLVSSLICLLITKFVL